MSRSPSNRRAITSSHRKKRNMGSFDVDEYEEEQEMDDKDKGSKETNCIQEEEEEEEQTDARMVVLDIEKIQRYLVCTLCDGYYRCAHTFVECLHTCTCRLFFISKCSNCKLRYLYPF